MWVRKHRRDFLALGLPRSGYYAHEARQKPDDTDRLALRAEARMHFNASRCAAGGHTIKRRLCRQGIEIGRFKVRRLMREGGLVSKQPGDHQYGHAPAERLDISSQLDRF
jgi:putative transposase